MMNDLKNAIIREIDIATANYKICMREQGQIAAWDYMGGRINFVSGMIAGAAVTGAISSAEAQQLNAWLDSLLDSL